MTVDYRVWLKDRKNPKSRLQFIKTKYFVKDLLETAHDLMMQQTDYDYICYRVDLVEITDFIM